MKTVEELFVMIEFYKQAEVIHEALRLEIFRHTGAPVESESVAGALGITPGRAAVLLDTLAAMDLLEKRGGRFVSTAFASRYLNPAAEEYIGDYYLFWMDRDNFTGLADLVRGVGETASPDPGGEGLRFRKLALVAAKEIHMKRSAYLVEAVAQMDLPEHFRVLDLGGGSGMLSIDLLRHCPQAEATVFDRAQVLEVAEELARENGVGNRFHTVSGDFLKDPIAGSYDLVIASGIMDFAMGMLPEFIGKLSGAMKPEGHLYVVTCGFNRNLTAPWQGVVNWLPRRLRGMNAIATQEELDGGFKDGGLELISERTIPSISQTFLEQVYRKQESRA